MNEATGGQRLADGIGHEDAGHEDMVAGLRSRLRTLLRSLDRQDRLETAAEFVGWLDAEIDAEQLDASAREMLLRALRVAGDPINHRILQALDPLVGISVAEVMTAAGLGRVATSERIHDLVQTGLATREMIGDQVRSTELATGLLTLVENVATDAASDLAAELRSSPTAPPKHDRTRSP